MLTMFTLEDIRPHAALIQLHATPEGLVTVHSGHVSAGLTVESQGRAVRGSADVQPNTGRCSGAPQPLPHQTSANSNLNITSQCAGEIYIQGAGR